MKKKKMKKKMAPKVDGCNSLFRADVAMVGSDLDIRWRKGKHSFPRDHCLGPSDVLAPEQELAVQVRHLDGVQINNVDAALDNT